MAFQVLILAAMLVRWTAALSVPIHSAPELPQTLDPDSCPPSFESHPVILLSVDGFRAEYLARGLTPTILALNNLGVRTPFMKPSYPTSTFPNHYTMVTGQHPSAHGIVDNRFYDPDFDALFWVGRPESFRKRWWGGEPIWVTARKQGKKSATFFWPGSEVETLKATYWYAYNESYTFENRVDQVLAWLELPVEERPQMITLYMHQPDRVGHHNGPYSHQMEDMLVRVDSVVKRLVEGIIERNLLSCVNLIVAADHGMSEVEAKEARVIRVDDYIPNFMPRVRFWRGSFIRIQPNDGTEATKKEMMEALACKRPEMRIYERSTVPARWHISDQRKVEEIIVDVDAGVVVGEDDTFKPDVGMHGYDNRYPHLNALFVAHGPEFKRNVEVESFQNIELYNLMCQLLGVEPSPNNGTWGALHHMLVNPPPSPTNPATESPPPVATFPLDDDTKADLMDGECEGDSLEGDEWLSILLDSHKVVDQITVEHMPWGTPALGRFRDTTVLLPQHDTVTAYSTLLKMPLWTSFTTVGKKMISHFAPWKSDVRLKKAERPPCKDKTTLVGYNVTLHPLFPPQLSKHESYSQLSYLNTNAVPVTRQMAYHWGQLEEFIYQWTKWYGALNIISGPVFDYNADTFVDDIEVLKAKEGTIVPSHMFMVVTRCLVRVRHLSECPHTHVDATAFIYPQSLVVSNCLSAERFAVQFMAKVDDVEKITGFRFFIDMSYDDRVKLAIRLHSNLWGKESWWNRFLTNFFGQK